MRSFFRLQALLLVVGLLCVPALTRVHQQLDSHDRSALTAPYSRTAECPPDKILALPVAFTVAIVVDRTVPVCRVFTVEFPPAVRLIDRSPDSLRAPPTA